MRIEQPKLSSSRTLQYATPQIRPRGWTPCIIGLFVWGSLLLLAIPPIITVAIYVAVIVLSLHPLIWAAFVAATLLILGIPPIITAYRMMRWDLRGAAWTAALVLSGAAGGRFLICDWLLPSFLRPHRVLAERVAIIVALYFLLAICQVFWLIGIVVVAQREKWQAKRYKKNGGY